MLARDGTEIGEIVDAAIAHHARVTAKRSGAMPDGKHAPPTRCCTSREGSIVL